MLYRAAAAHTPAKFVNLDMEEYRDLHLTVAAFQHGRSTKTSSAASTPGIVLQAYLPDSYAVLRRAVRVGGKRDARAAAAGIKIRIVKGANLAMEHVDAEMHGWAAAPFDTKADVDANYKRMLDVLLRPGSTPTPCASAWRRTTCSTSRGR